MKRKFNKYGKPLPNKSDLKYLKFVDDIIKKRLVNNIEDELDDSHEKFNLTSYLDQFDIEELSQMIFDDIGEFKLVNRKNVPLYYIFLKLSMEYWYKSANYSSLKKSVYVGSWETGWIPNIVNKLGLDFEEAYAIVILWLSIELKKMGTTIPEIENNILETKELIRKILREQIITNEHSICGILTCNELDEVLDKIDYDKLSPLQKERLEKIKSNYKRDVTNNLKDVPKNGGLKGATGDSEKDFCDEYLSEIQTLICEPTQE